MKKRAILLSIGLVVFIAGISAAADIPVSEATSECIDCHAVSHPGIVEDWRNSRHARVTPKQAMSVQGLARKMSAATLAEDFQEVAVGCAECHGMRPGSHADTFEHNGYDVHVVVSPKDCATCHPQEDEQYAENLMSHAYANLADNKLYNLLEQSIIGKLSRTSGKIIHGPADADTKAEACYYCHGTKLKVSGYETRDTESAGELKFPIIEGWPNQGVGRINLDGSKGSCSACHTRHRFSIEMARKPYTCKECHVGPDVPAFKVYSASKHGNIFSAMQKTWDLKAVPWTIGKDFTAPTCAACHVSLLVNSDEEVVVKRSHQMNNRLPWRIFGVIYAHPHPIDADTTVIRNKDNQPAPTELGGGFAAPYLIDAKEQDARRQTMQAICLNCHDTSWVNGHWRRFENTIQRTNADILTATQIMQDIWRAGYAKGLETGANPFDEAVEKKWTDIWQFYANTTRFASAMGGGGDYGVYAGGQYQMTQALLELHDWLELRNEIAGSKKN